MKKGCQMSHTHRTIDELRKMTTRELATDINDYVASSRMSGTIAPLALAMVLAERIAAMEEHLQIVEGRARELCAK